MGDIYEVKNTGEVKLNKFATNPDPTEEGTVIYNTTDKKLRYYNGVEWVDTGRIPDTALFEGGELFTAIRTPVITTGASAHIIRVSSVSALDNGSLYSVYQSGTNQWTLLRLNTLTNTRTVMRVASGTAGADAKFFNENLGFFVQASSSSTSCAIWKWNGSTWTEVFTFLSGSTTTQYSVRMEISKDGFIAASVRDFVAVSPDFGETWIRKSATNAGNYRSVGTLTMTDNYIYVVVNSSSAMAVLRLQKSTYDTTNFTNIGTTGLGNVYTSIAVPDDNNIWIYQHDSSSLIRHWNGSNFATVTVTGLLASSSTQNKAFAHNNKIYFMSNDTANNFALIRIDNNRSTPNAVVLDNRSIRGIYRNYDADYPCAAIGYVDVSMLAGVGFTQKVLASKNLD